MATERNVVRLFTIYGDEIDYTLEEWTEYYDNEIPKRIGRAIMRGDKVTFTGLAGRGSLVINDGVENTTEDMWCTETIVELTDEEKLAEVMEQYSVDAENDPLWKLLED